MALLLEAGNLFAFSLSSSPPHKLFFPHFNLSFSYSLSFSHCTRTRARALNSTSIPQFLRSSSKSSGCVSRDPRTSCSDPWGDSNSVEVVVIGSRKDALLDFCLESSFESAASIRFWTIHMRDSVKVQLLQRSLGTDMLLKNVEVPLSVQSCPQAVVLVATAGYGSDDTTAVELLGAVKSADGLGVAIVLKPFGFEGQRRQNEVEDLIKILQEHRIFCIVVDTDALLKKEVVTLAEALSSAHTAILLAINAIVVLMCEMHPKILDSPNVKWKETKVSEILTLLERYGEAEVGFGAGYNMKSSIAQAVFDCPFISSGLQDMNGIVFCIVASATALDESDVCSFIHAFRQTTKCTNEIILSRIHEPSLEPNLIVTTVIILGCNRQKAPPKKSFFSGLALRFPFVFSLWGRGSPKFKDHLEALSPGGQHSLEALSSSNGRDMPVLNPNYGSEENLDVYSEESEPLLRNNCEGISAWRKCNGEEDSGIGFSAVSSESISPFSDQSTEGQPSFERELINSWNVGPGLDIAEQWAKERAVSFGATAKSDKLNALPVGVKPSEQSKDGSQFLNPPQPADLKNIDDMTGEVLDNPNFRSWDALTDASFEAIMDFCNATSTYLKGKSADVPKKQGLLSARASSMLEAERDSQKKWAPVTEMKYRGGNYRGRCQGGLPEGKGRLALPDGSCYDGMWRFGKRSGLGTFCYNNGDVFQGSWRDDLIHGKGWFYFHTGDRWFANFWKGKANGEGRFYSKLGNIFFGNFQDGWRHGQCLSIDIDGTRWDEVWDEGVLISRKKLDDSETGMR